jgi:2-acylglycerol O-acyltransferase 2
MICLGRIPGCVATTSGGTNCQAIWPHWKVYSLAASSVFGVPFWHHFLTWIGCVPATSGNFKKMLSKGSVAVVVGCIAEMYMQVG